MPTSHTGIQDVHRAYRNKPRANLDPRSTVFYINKNENKSFFALIYREKEHEGLSFCIGDIGGLRQGKLSWTRTKNNNRKGKGNSI